MPQCLLTVYVVLSIVSVLFCIIFIHFYSASHSMSLSEALQTTAIDTVSEFTRQSATGNCMQVKDLPKAPTWRLERDLNLRPSGRKTSTLPMRHHIPIYIHIRIYMYIY